MAAAKHYGLQLTLGNAPNTPHTIDGVHGLFRPNVPCPVDVPGTVSLETAKALDKDARVALKLVELTKDEFDAAVAQRSADMQTARSSLKVARRTAEGADAVRLVDEANSLKEEN